MVGGERIDPASKARQEHLYGQAEQYAATNPFSQRYGGQVPGMTGMGQAGQQFMANRLLGPGAYQAQNLGFQNYQPQFSYQPQGQPPGPSGYTPFTPPGQPPGGQPSGVPAAARVEEQNQIQTASTTYDPNTAIGEAARVRADGQFRDGGGEGGSDLTPAGRAAAASGGFERTPAEIAAGVEAGGLGGWKEQNRAANAARNAAQPQGSISIDGGVDIHGNPLEAPDPNRMAVRGGGGEGERSVFSGGMLQPEPGFSDEFGGGPALRIGQPSIGMPSREDYTPRPGDGRGMQQQPPGFSDEFGPGGTHGGGTDADFAPGGRYEGTGGPGLSAPSMGGGGLRGQQQQQMPGGQQQPFVPAAIGAMEGVLNRAEPSAIEAERVGRQNLGQTRDVRVDPVTGQTTSQMNNITEANIGGPEQLSIDPVTGETTQSVENIDERLGMINSPNSIQRQTVDAASALGRPEGQGISDYMNASGVDTQIASAQEDYEQQLNALQSRQAGSGAFGSRGDLEEMGAMDQHLRNVGQIRAAGFDKAAQRMEQDLGREQQAGIQTAQFGQQADLQRQQLEQQAITREAELGQQAAMQGQSLEAQRRAADASRLQQANLQGQQLQSTMDLQGQQLGQDALTQEAQLRQQGRMQGQSLEAQRRAADAGRLQQANLQGQDLQTRANMQTQSLDQQRAIQQAQLAQDAGEGDADRALRAAQMTQQGSQQYVSDQLRGGQMLGQEERATGAALQNMGRDQRDIQQDQMAFDYEQWLRSQEGGGRELAMLQGMLPEAERQKLQREKGLGSQLFGGLLAGGGLASKFIKPGGGIF